MARTNSLTNFLTDVAEAIKEKKGSEADITASNFDTEILNLPAQGVYQQKTVSVTQNGTTTVTPDANYDAIDELTINTAVPEKQLQTKTYNFTQNANLELTPDTGYDGFNKINLEINVAGGQINNQNKTITENGVYTADTGYTGIGTATVNVVPPIKMYNTREEMMLDTSEPEHEYGIVYGNKPYPIEEGTQCAQFVCKDTVTLDNAITTTKIWSDVSRDLTFRIQPKSVTIRYYGTNAKRVQYTSSDGITYTTTATLVDRTFEGNFDFTTYTSYSWIPEISDFLIGVEVNFEGMYEYVNETDNEWFDSITGITLANNVFTSTNEELYIPTLNLTMRNLNTATHPGDGTQLRYFVYEQNGHYYAQEVTGKFGKKLTDNDIYLAITNQQVGSQLTSKPLYELDLENEAFTFVDNVYAEFIATSSAANYGWKRYSFNDIKLIGIFLNGNYEDFSISYIIDGSSLLTPTGYTNECQYGHVSFLTWHHVKTQFTLESPNQLYPDVIALGKHGPVTGTDDIWNNIPLSVIYERLGLELDTSDLYGPPTDYFSNVYENDKLVYLTANTNGQYIFGKPEQSHYISFVLDEGENLIDYAPVFSDDMQYAAVMSDLYDSTNRTYTYTIRFYNNGSLCYTKILHTGVAHIDYFGSADFCGRGFHNHDFYFTDMLDKVIYKYDCDQNIWSTYTNQYGPFGLLANKYMVMGKYNSGSSDMTNSIRIQNLDTGNHYDYTYYGSTSAGSWSEIPAYYTDGTNMYCIGKGSSSDNGYVYIVTPTNCIRVLTSQSWYNNFYQREAGTYTILLDNTHRLIIPRSYTKPVYMPVIDVSNNTVQVISYDGYNYDLHTNIYGQLVSGGEGEGSNITIYNGDELSISNNVLIIPQKTAQIADFNDNQKWKNRKTGDDSITLYFYDATSFWSERNNKIYFETNHTTSEPTVSVPSHYPIQIECIRCNKTTIKPNSISNYAVVINANSATNHKKQINTITFCDNVTEVITNG